MHQKTENGSYTYHQQLIVDTNQPILGVLP
jgi:hypothetical protein